MCKGVPHWALLKESCLQHGRISRPWRFDTLEEHGQSSSKMTLFPFATQATEQVPGASIEKPRVWVINLAAFQLIVSVDRNEQYKQQ